MENSFLTRSSLVLGILLAVSPIANAESDATVADDAQPTTPEAGAAAPASVTAAPASTLDDPEVLEKLLGALDKQAREQAAGANGQRFVAPGDTTALDDPDVMARMLEQMAAQTAASAPADTTALDDPDVMAKMLQQLAAQAAGPEVAPVDTSALDDPDLMAAVLGALDTVTQPEAAAVAAEPTALDDPAILMGLLSALDQPAMADSVEIFEPTPRVYSFSDIIPARRGLVGGGISRQASSSFGEHTLLSGNLRYHVSDNWDALLGLELGLNSFGNPDISDSSGKVLLREKRSFRTLTAGGSYALLNGISSLDGETYIPWKLSADIVLGEQFTGGSHGLYYGIGTSLQILQDDYWYGLDTRYFRVNDDTLNKVGTHRGLQWGLAFGFYY